MAVGAARKRGQTLGAERHNQVAERRSQVAERHSQVAEHLQLIIHKETVSTGEGET
jgi:hypothetical protein